jgi:hypothetical protein
VLARNFFLTLMALVAALGFGGGFLFARRTPIEVGVADFRLVRHSAVVLGESMSCYAVVDASLVKHPFEPRIVGRLDNDKEAYTIKISADGTKMWIRSGTDAESGAEGLGTPFQVRQRDENDIFAVINEEQQIIAAVVDMQSKLVLTSRVSVGPLVGAFGQTTYILCL